MEEETLTTALPDTPEADVESPEGGLGQALTAFVKAIWQMVKGLLIFLLRLIPILIWAAAVLFWGYEFYRLAETVVGLYAPERETVALVAWIAIVTLTNLPTVGGSVYKAREGDRKAKFFRFGGVMAGLGLADLAGRHLLQVMATTAPLLTLSLPHLFLGVGMVFTKWPQSGNAEAPHQHNGGDE